MGSLLAAIEEWAAADVRTLDSSRLGSDLVGLRRVVDRLEAEFVRRLAEFDRRGGSADEALSTAAWLRHHCRLSPIAASARLTAARRLPGLPVTAAAFAAGDVSLDHVRAMTLIRDETARAAVAAMERPLVEHAIQACPVQTARLVRHVVHAAAPDVLAQQAEQLHERRWLALSETFEGAFAIDGMLDPESGATLRTALHALMAGDRQSGDARTPAQARADALTVLARQVLDHGAVPEVAGERPHLSVLVDLSTLERRSGARAAALGWAGPISGETARRLACDARVTRVITDGSSVPLDVGRATRVVPAALRRALEIRDGGCTWPGCDRPPPWTDAHHVRHWADGGATSLDNLVLLCRRHHRATHEGRAPSPAPRVCGPLAPVGLPAAHVRGGAQARLAPAMGTAKRSHQTSTVNGRASPAGRT